MGVKSKILLLVIVFLWAGSAVAGQWQFMGLPAMEISSIETCPDDYRKIAATTTVYGLYVSFDAGDTWDWRLATNVPFSHVSYDPWHGDSLLSIMADSWSAGLYCSDDFGDHWHLVYYLIYPGRMGFDPRNEGRLYVTTDDGIIYSEDYGHNCEIRNNGLPHLNILDVTGDGENACYAYVAGEDYVAKTTDCGQSWVDVGGSFGMEDYNPARIEYEPNAPQTLYAACWAYLARSSDRGENWDYFPTPGTGNNAIVCSPYGNGKFYLGSNSGVHVSFDAGETFLPMNDGLGNLSVKSLEIDQYGRLLAGTGYGIFKYEIPVGIFATPHEDPLYVQPGGFFNFTGILTNNTPFYGIGDVWIMVRTPDGSLFGPLQIFRGVPLSPGQTIIAENIEQYVPHWVPFGEYEYVSYAGLYPNLKIDSSSFNFTVRYPRGGDADEWKLSGWFDDQYAEKPAAVRLYDNYPNPFNAATVIEYEIPSDCRVKLEVYNIMGQLIGQLVDEYQQAGNYKVNWNGESFSSGIYFYKLTTGDKQVTKRMTLLK
ncbi:MAG: T9SS type A sorting domain-containing protein [candidate division Zixibacteria bacterium]|nr:T9SS type A sorting domain-containing protein [candidate division Zixibacteria bacterium]